MRAWNSPHLKRRIAAYLADLLVIMGLVMVTLIASIFAYGHWKYSGDHALMKDLVARPRTKNFAQASHAIFFFSYFTICHWYFGRTPGKWLFGLEVTHHGHGLSFPRALLRSFGYFVSGSLTFGLGYLPALFRQDERTLHDLMADTDVHLLRAPRKAEQAPPGQDQAA